MQCWIRISGLAQEHWRPKLLFAIANSIGTPICLDDTASKSLLTDLLVTFAQILVDMDL